MTRESPDYLNLNLSEKAQKNPGSHTSAKKEYSSDDDIRAPYSDGQIPQTYQNKTAHKCTSE